MDETRKFKMGQTYKAKFSDWEIVLTVSKINEETGRVSFDWNGRYYKSFKIKELSNGQQYAMIPYHPKKVSIALFAGDTFEAGL